MSIKPNNNAIIVTVIILIVISVYFQINKTVFSKTRKLSHKNSIDLAIGLVESDLIKCIFTNDGNFSKYNSFQPSSKFSGIRYKKAYYLGDLHLWLGVPEGEWTPRVWDNVKKDSVSLGPTVSGTFFHDFKKYYYIKNTDFGPVPGSRNLSFSGDLLLSDVYTVTDELDLPMLTNNKFPTTWAENIYGERVWPGKWKIDPITNKEISGQFRADQEVYFEFTDISYAGNPYPSNYEEIGFLKMPLRGYDIGAEVMGNVLIFEDKYAEDFLFVDLKMINTSQWNYEGVYSGIYFRPSLYRADWDWIRQNTQHDENINYLIRDIDPKGEEFNYDLSYYYFDMTPLPEMGPFHYIGIKLLQTAPYQHPQKNKRNAFEHAVIRKQLGLTGWHLLNDYGIGENIWVGDYGYFNLKDHPLKRGELIQYKLLAGDTTNLLPVEEERFFYPNDSTLNPKFDNIESIRLPFDPATLMSSGPFNWDSGDTVKFAFAVVFGEDLEDLKANCRVAQKMYDHNYRRMEAPEAPTVSAVAGDKQVTLYWNDAAENSADFLTGYHDFEGYRIYRTSVDPALNQWGEEIRDGNGELVGFVPLAQFDLKNGITGLDPEYPHLELGFDSGIQHSWTDTTVKNGVSYWYAVCAYDQGISPDSLRNPDGWARFKSLENSRGTDAELWRNLVRVTPGAAPSNYMGASLKLIPLPGSRGNGPIVAEIIDAAAVSGHTYTVIFDDTSQSWLTYSVKDEATGQMVLQQVSQVHGEEGPIFDGIRLNVRAFDAAGLYADSSGWFRLDSGDSSDCNYTIEAVSLLKEAVLDNYEFRFTGRGDTSYILGKTAPFELWNVSRREKLDWEIFTNSKTDSTDSLKSVWSSGDYIRIREQVAGAYKFTWDVRMTRNPEIRYVERDTTLDGYPATVIDTLIIDNPPQTDDVARIITAKPFHSGDRFSLQTVPVQAQTAEKDELSLIKVVPNPYLVTAAWERHRDDHRLSFTHLPAQCEILIFNVAGEIVAVLEHDNVYSGTAFWDLQSYEGMEVTSGLYLYVVKTPQGKSKEGKFVVVR